MTSNGWTLSSPKPVFVRRLQPPPQPFRTNKSNSSLRSDWVYYTGNKAKPNINTMKLRAALIGILNICLSRPAHNLLPFFGLHLLAWNVLTTVVASDANAAYQSMPLEDEEDNIGLADDISPDVSDTSVASDESEPSIETEEEFNSIGLQTWSDGGFTLIVSQSLLPLRCTSNETLSSYSHSRLSSPRNIIPTSS